MDVWQKTEREREKGRGARGAIRRQRLHEFSHFIIISLSRPQALTITTVHIHTLQLVNTVA